MLATSFRDLRPLAPYLRPYRRQYVLGILALLGEAAFWVAVPKIIGISIDDLQQEVTARKLLYYSALLIGMALCKAFFLFWTRMILIGISRDAEYDLRNDLYRHLSKLSLSYFHKTRTGDLMSRATNDLNAVRMMLGPGIMYLGRTIALLVAATVVLVRINPKLTFYCLGLAPLVAAAVSYFGFQIHERFETIQAMMSSLSAKVQESLSAIRVLRAFVQEEADLKRFRKLNEEYLEKNRKLIRVWGLFYPSLEVLIGFVFVLVLWVGGHEVARGHMSIGSFVAFNVYMGQLSWPMIALGYVVNLFQRGTASMGRLHEVFLERPEIADAPNGSLLDLTNPALVPAASPGNGHGGDIRQNQKGVEIEFRNLSFSYGDRPVLRNIDLTIPAGTTLAIVGPTGSGKSTLANLIPRLYEAPPGTLFLNDRDVREYGLASLRRAIGFVPQETFLFSETLRENIAFGVGRAAEEEVREAAAVAGLLSDVESFPRGFDTLVGERGITLSGGQKQRAAIARAVLRNPRVLILDDALSSVDTYTEEMILTRLQTVLRGRTAILISHRISTVRGADQIIVLQDGRIAERGTHTELLREGSHYAELYQRQLLEEELERA